MRPSIVESVIQKLQGDILTRLNTLLQSKAYEYNDQAIDDDSTYNNEVRRNCLIKLQELIQPLRDRDCNESIDQSRLNTILSMILSVAGSINPKGFGEYRLKYFRDGSKDYYEPIIGRRSKGDIAVFFHEIVAYASRAKAVLDNDDKDFSCQARILGNVLKELEKLSSSLSNSIDYQSERLQQIKKLILQKLISLTVKGLKLCDSSTDSVSDKLLQFQNDVSSFTNKRAQKMVPHSLEYEAITSGRTGVFVKYLPELFTTLFDDGNSHESINIFLGMWKAYYFQQSNYLLWIPVVGFFAMTYAGVRGGLGYEYSATIQKIKTMQDIAEKAQEENSLLIWRAIAKLTGQLESCGSTFRLELLEILKEWVIDKELGLLARGQELIGTASDNESDSAEERVPLLGSSDSFDGLRNRGGGRYCRFLALSNLPGAGKREIEMKPSSILDKKNH